MSETAGSTPLIEKETDKNPVEIIREGKTITVILLSADTDDVSGRVAKKYYHECELTDGAGNISTVAVGEVDLREVTLRRT